MIVSIFTTSTRPKERGDPIDEALKCYNELADEVINIDDEWPEEFEWSYIGKQFQKGYEACKGDWVIRMDTDMIFHEDDYEKVLGVLSNHDYAPAVTFTKRQFIQPNRYNVKSRLVLAVNKRLYKDHIRFDGGGDLCQATLNGEYIAPNYVPDKRIPFWNYECILKTKAQIMEDKGRFARAWQRTFGSYTLGGPDDESAYEHWHRMMVGRYNKPHREIPLSDHPKVMQETIKNLKPENWGYNMFGAVDVKSY